MSLSPRFEEALVYSFRRHAGQARKSTDVPYISHLLGVTSLVLEAGGDETEAIAALLHDAVEDQGGLETLKEIQERFGHEVADIVLAMSDSTTVPKPPWRSRKEQFLARLRNAPPGVVRVALGDKLHNARDILRDLKSAGPEVWNRFRGGKEETIWYYRSLADILETKFDHPLVQEYLSVVAEIETIARDQP